jgi:hypothetical protein
MTESGRRGDYRHWVGVLNQGPLLSTTNVFRIEHMLAARPSTVTAELGGIDVGDVAPDFTLDRTDGQRVALASFRGRPVVMRLTRAVSDGII